LLAVILIIFVNVCGFLLKLYGFDRHIVLLGFRFHISLLIPLFLLFRGSAFEKVKNSLSVFSIRKFFTVFLFAVLPPLLIVGGLYLINGIELSDPDYFYELGLSSIVDYPVYLIWNAPQLIILGLFLKVITSGKKYKFPLILPAVISLFAFELIPAGKENFRLISVLDFAMASVLFSLFFSRINNVYYMALYTFTVLWSHVLLFGTGVKALVNLLLAKNYDTWEGFFTVTIKSISMYTFLLQAGISLILLLFMLVLFYKKDKFQAAETNNMGIPDK
jgi:hypothetical protein